ncbi:MAG: hypothetical protein N2V77_00470 [Canidatus Methanoxibalbensis ujae]|nr:hypothetical protein [Candidatus Methanoxibalbensis ujae]
MRLSAVGASLTSIQLLIVVLLASVVISAACLGVFGKSSNTASSVVNVANTPPSFISLSIPDDSADPGYQVINPDPERNRTVRLEVVLCDMNGHDDISNVNANITGPSHVDPFTLKLNRTLNVSTAVYEGYFNMSHHKQGEYTITVRACDKGGMSSQAELNFTYLPAVNLTIYDFAEGAGEDKWAYRRQHDEKPPSRNDVPGVSFSQPGYNLISEDDGRTAIDGTSKDGNYAIHRFNFKIKERVPDITRVEVLWKGLGTHITDERGATLYIWNFSSGAYDELDRGTDVFLTLHGNITENICNYIDDDGMLVVAVEQNSPQSRWFMFKLRSYIATDYICVNVSYIPHTVLNILDVKPTALVVRPGAEIRFDINVTNEGAPGTGYVNGTVVYPNGTKCDIGFERTEHMETGGTSTVYLHWTVPEDAPPGIYGFIASSWDRCSSGCDGFQDEVYLRKAFRVI